MTPEEEALEDKRLLKCTWSFRHTSPDDGTNLETLLHAVKVLIDVVRQMQHGELECPSVDADLAKADVKLLKLIQYNYYM